MDKPAPNEKAKQIIAGYAASVAEAIYEADPLEFGQAALVQTNDIYNQAAINIANLCFLKGMRPINAIRKGLSEAVGYEVDEAAALKVFSKHGSDSPVSKRTVH